MGTVLELILIGAKIFSSERQRYYENKVKGLMRTIMAIEDADFYEKDMNAKAKAERELHLQIEDLRKEFVKEALK